MELKQNITEESPKKDLAGDMKDYINLRIELIRLNLTEKISIALSGSISGGLIVTAYLLFCLFGSVAIGFWISSMIGNYAIGFICVAGIYLLAAILFQFSAKSFKSKLTDKFISDFSNDDDE